MERNQKSKKNLKPENHKVQKFAKQTWGNVPMGECAYGRGMPSLIALLNQNRLIDKYIMHVYG